MGESPSLGTAFADRVRAVFTLGPNALLGLADDLLRLSLEHPLRLDHLYQDDHCTIRRLDAADEEPIAIPLPKAVFRAVIARMYGLAYERAPRPESPYGGRGEVALDGDPSPIVRVAFPNNPGDQWLELIPAPAGGGGFARG